MSDSAIRMPQRPPDWSDLVDQLGKKEVPSLLVNIVASRQDTNSYEHWDSLRYKKAPSNMTREKWWLAIKIARMRDQKVCGLSDKGGDPFLFGSPACFHERLNKIDMWAGGRVEMAEQVTNPATRDQYYVSSIVQEAITSSQLEGAVTTREVAKEMLRSERPPVDDSERMILNNYLTMQRLVEFRDQPLTPDRVLEIHRSITQGTMSDPADEGSLRTADRKVEVTDPYNVVLHEPPPADELVERLDIMCAFANGEIPDTFVHPVVRSIILHFWLAYDHPFVDGNGRTARALFYWSMLRYGYWLAEFISISQVILEAPKQYYRAFLYTETDGNDLCYFIDHQLKVINGAVDKLHDFIERKTSQMFEIDNLIEATISFNRRQRTLLSHALRHPNQRYTTESHRSRNDVAYQTARNDLLRLEQSGLLTKQRVGKIDYFRPIPELRKKLASLR